jgi:hypothetical protein
MATVTLHSKSDAADQATIVTTDNFGAWKKKQGTNSAFVVQMPGADDEDDGGILICNLSEMRRLPTGQYQAQLVRRCAIPDEAKKELRGSDLWKCA